MTPGRWKQIEELFHSAMEHGVAVLEGSDPDLRREVENLLAQASDFLEHPTGTLLERTQELALSIGDKLGPYEILAAIGEGGMGKVYKACDTRLNRLVAVKVSQERFSERFDREARTVASLNHPNICTLHDVGPNYLVMELVEGETIAELLKRGPIERSTALLYASQILAALAEAHAKGIVHRDLKPRNIMIARSGVKVLDFGLAKSGQDETLTASRMIMGTPAYMSPEQREGKPADARSDIYSFGCVFSEMLTGARAGSRQRRVTPRKMERILGRCLEEDPELRWRSANELARELASVTPAKSRRKLVVAAAAAALAFVSAGYFYFRPVGSSPAASADLSAYKFTPISRDEATERGPSWSPDGKSIVYVANVRGVMQVFTRALGSSEAQQITRGEQSAYDARWSPDGSTIYYLSSRELWSVGATGGIPERIFQGIREFALHPDGKTFLLLPSANEVRIGVRGETPALVPNMPLPSLPSGVQTLYGFSPDGSRIAYFISGDIWIVPYPATEAAKVQRFPVGDALYASWIPDSRHLVVSKQDDRSRYSLSMLDTDNSSLRTIYTSPDTLLYPAVSPDGKRIAYSAGRVDWRLVEIGIPDGSVRFLRSSHGTSWWPSWDPSGTHYLYITNSSGKWTIEDASANENFSRRIAELDGASLVTNVAWAPDGSRFTFFSSPRNGGGGGKIMLSNASGSRITPLDASGLYTDGAHWSPDGQWIVYRRKPPETKEVQVARIHPGSVGEPEILTTYMESDPEERSPVSWSPTGQWILAWSQNGLYLETPDFKQERKLTSRSAVPAFDFSKDGRQVFAILHTALGKGAEWQLFSFDIATGMEKKLADVDLPVTTGAMRGFSLHPDGKRFATAIANWPYDIWMMEGFDQPAESGKKTTK